jgi:asparagine synthase (glutamine-hydrolysing)
LRFASEPKALLAAEDADCAVDLDGFRELMLSSHPMINTPGRTAFAGIAELPPGHVLVSTPDSSQLWRYWSLQPREHDDDLPATISTVRSLVSQAVHSHLEAEVPRCTLLSGGLDSSFIASLVHQEPIPGQDTVSVDVGAGSGVASDGMARSPDAPFIELMAAHLGSLHRDVRIPAAVLASPLLRQQVVSARDGLGLGDFDASLLLLFRAVRERHTVALSGEAADEVFGGYRWSIPGTARPISHGGR